MAKVTTPLMSIEASGSIGDLLTFSKRKSGMQVRFQKKQKDILTNTRVLQRWRYQAAVNAWNNLSESGQLFWITQAENMHMTGYNLFIKRYLDNLTGQVPPAFYGLAIYALSYYGEIYSI